MSRGSRFRFLGLVRERESLLCKILGDPIVGARRKVTIRGEAYEWAPVLGVFDKLHEVGVSSYLSFKLCLSVFMMLELFEALNGRLISPKT